MGFSLIEILIAIVVLAIGLLGLANLQLRALQGNSQSYERSQAHMLAYEISDAMRANREGARMNAFAQNPLSAAPTVTADCGSTTVTCTPEQAATYARRNWVVRLQTVLPGARARISCSSTPPALCPNNSLYSVQVMWNEYRRDLSLNATTLSCPDGATFNEELHFACVQLTFVP